MSRFAVRGLLLSVACSFAASALAHASPLFFYVAQGDIRRALRYCDLATSRETGAIMTDDRRCYTGAMMMLFFPYIDPDWDEPAPYALTAENVHDFCVSLEDSAYVGACLRASWPLDRARVTREGGVDEFCKGQPDVIETEWCYAKVFVALGWLYLNDPTRAGELCAAVSVPWQENCYVQVTQQYVAEGRAYAVSRAVAVCNGARLDVRDRCLSVLARSSGKYEEYGSTGRTRYCDALPSAWHESCHLAPTK